MKRQKTIEVDICDVCGREGHLPERCCVCQQELCELCHRMLRVEIHEGHPGAAGVVGTCSIITTGNKGYRGVYCPTHSQDLGDTLRAAGFTDFAYRSPWGVTLESVPNLTISTGGATVQGTTVGSEPLRLDVSDVGSSRHLQDIGPGAWLDDFPKEPPPPGYTRDVNLNLVKREEAP